MGSGYEHKCDRCGYEVATSGPWEFYRDELGLRHPYGHPVPASDEAERAGIAGLSAEMYCLDCRQVSDVILVEFVRPAEDSLLVWLGRCEPMEEYRHEGAVRCPSCGSTNLLLGPDETRTIPCPRCGVGRVVGRETWVS